MSDLIKRQDAIEAAQKIIDTYEARMPEWSGNDMLTSGRDTATKYGHIADGAEKVKKAIENLPSAEPKKGRWIGNEIDNDFAKCSECGSHWEWGLVRNCNMDFCPNCGADMRGEE